MSIETRVYAIYDVKTGMYGPVMTFANDGTAIRSFQEMIIASKGESLLALYPSDYILFCLGIYNQELGKIECCPAPMNILSGAEAFTRACVEAENRRKRASALSGRNDINEDSDFITPSGLQKNAGLAYGITSDTINSVPLASDDKE